MKRKSQGGHAMLEFAFFAPWFLFLGVGALDWGYYSQALIAVQSAARSAALHTSSSTGTAADSSTACALVLDQLRQLPNIDAGTTNCNASPLIVAAAAVTGPDNAAASRVTVTYETIPLVPIPGLLRGRLTITRSVELKI